MMVIKKNNPHGSGLKGPSTGLTKSLSGRVISPPLSDSISPQPDPRRIRNREKLILALKWYGTFMHAWNQFSLTCAVNKGKYSHHFLYPMLLIEFCMLCCCAWVKLDLKLQICAKGGLSLFRILLEPDQGLIRNICPNEALLWVPARKFYF